MTYSHNTPESPSPLTPNPASPNAAYVDAVAPVGLGSEVTARITALVLWLCVKLSASQSPTGANAFRQSRLCKLGIMALVLLLMALPGSRADKTARLKQAFSKANDTLDRLYAKYVIWRQRMCWMWGGGFMSGALARAPFVLTQGISANAFEKLIPD